MWLPGVARRSSPNYSARGNYAAEGVVWHYTGGGSATSTIKWLRDPASFASAHFVVARDGSFAQLVELDKRAWHAGVSEMFRPATRETEPDVNRWTIGVEVANHGRLEKDRAGGFWYGVGGSLRPYGGPEPIRASLAWDTGHQIRGYWEPYPEEQIMGCLELARRLGSVISGLWHIGHQDVAMPVGRKVDPGPLWPWERFRTVAETPVLRAWRPGRDLEVLMQSVGYWWANRHP